MRRFFLAPSLLGFLAILLGACGGGSAAVREATTVLRLLSQESEQISTTEVVSVRYCVAPEQTERNCSAGTQSNLSIGGGLGSAVPRFDALSVSADVSLGLGFSRESGASLGLPTPDEGFVNLVTIEKQFRVVRGEAIVQNGSNREERVPYVFQASCNLQIVSIETLTCEAAAEIVPTPVPTREVPLVPGQIAFVNDEDGNKEIYLINVDGSNQMRLTFDEGVDVAPSWSPDGQQIAFISSREGTFAPFLMRADGSDARRSGSANDVVPLVVTERTRLIWSPDGRRIAFHCGKEVCVVALNSGTVVRIGKTDETPTVPAWSPDGRQLAFIDHVAAREMRLVLADPEDGSTRTLYEPDNTIIGDPSWSPDGQRLAVALDPPGSSEEEGERILVLLDPNASPADFPVVDFTLAPSANTNNSGSSSERLGRGVNQGPTAQRGNEFMQLIPNTEPGISLVIQAPMWVFNGEGLLYRGADNIWYVASLDGELVNHQALANAFGQAIISPGESKLVLYGTIGGLFVHNLRDMRAPSIRIAQAPWSDSSPPAWRPLPMGRVQAPDSLRVRDEPSLEALIVGRIDDGLPVEITAMSEDGLWLRVRAEDQERGWVSAEFIQR